MKPAMTTDASSGNDYPANHQTPPANGINNPVYYGGDAHPQYIPVSQQQQHQQPAAANGSPLTHHQSHQPGQGSSWHQQLPSHFQDDFFGPDMDVFPRNRLGRIHDPFSDFPNSDFGFPQFGSLGRRRVQGDPMADEHDFFTNIPSEFRQYIPANMTHRRVDPPMQRRAGPQMQQAHPSQYMPANEMPHPNTMPHYPTKKVCDAAIQTENVNAGVSETDSSSRMEPRPNPIEEQTFRNTVDMGVLTSAPGNEFHGARSYSAPQQTEEALLKHAVPVQESEVRRATPPTQTHSKPVPSSAHSTDANANTQQQSKTMKAGPKPEENVRRIPIFVESRSQLINNPDHPETPNATTTRNVTPTQQYAPSSQFQPQQQQQQPPMQQPQQQYQQHPQQQPQQHQQTDVQGDDMNVPQTPHTLDSINKIQNIQRDVLELMSKVETFAGKRQDKEYMYLDEMLTRNLLKLDTIDTNGKDSIRLARKEAIKCIQASINVLEAKAEENSRAAEEVKDTANANVMPAADAENNVSEPPAAVVGEVQQQSAPSPSHLPTDEIESAAHTAIPLPAPDVHQADISKSNSIPASQASDNDNTSPQVAKTELAEVNVNVKANE